MNIEEIIDVGYRAEKYFFDYLKNYYEEKEVLWHSSFIKRQDPNLNQFDLSEINDSIGFDMEVFDHKLIFDNKSKKKCLFEIKGSSQPLKNVNSFLITNNELTRAEKAKINNELYIVVLVGGVGSVGENKYEIRLIKDFTKYKRIAYSYKVDLNEIYRKKY